MNTCKQCNKLFIPLSKFHPNQKFCCNKCCEKWQTKNKKNRPNFKSTTQKERFEEILNNLKLTNETGTKLLKIKTGENALVDANIYNSLLQYTWTLSNHGYAVTSRCKLHKFIAKLNNLPEKETIDHINQNKLDNRLINLRPATVKENNRNVSKQSNTKYKYKGIHLTASGKYQAMIWYNKKNHCLGSFLTQEEAAIAYNTEALKIFGEFACLNIIN